MSIRVAHIVKMLNMGRLTAKTVTWLKAYGFRVIYDEFGQAVNIVEIQEDEPCVIAVQV